MKTSGKYFSLALVNKLVVFVGSGQLQLCSDDHRIYFDCWTLMLYREINIVCCIGRVIYKSKYEGWCTANTDSKV